MAFVDAIKGPHRYKEGDTDPPIEYDLIEQNRASGEWEPMDITNATVTLRARERRTRRTFSGVCAKGADGVPNRVSYTPLTTDLKRGEYRFEFLITRPGPASATVPGGDSYYELIVGAPSV